MAKLNFQKFEDIVLTHHIVPPKEFDLFKCKYENKVPLFKAWSEAGLENKLLDEIFRIYDMGEPLLDIMYKFNFITKEEYKEAELRLQENPNENIGSILMKLGYLTPEELKETYCKHFGLDPVSLKHFDISKVPQTQIGQKFAQKYELVIINQNSSDIHLAVSLPSDELISKLSNLFPQRIKISVANRYEIDKCLKKIYPETNIDINKIDLEIGSIVKVKEPPSDIPSYLEYIIHTGIKKGASDIFLKPTPHGLDIRYKIDGVKRKISLEKETEYNKRPNEIINRIKIISQTMDITRKFINQSGSFKIRYSNGEKTHKVDIRIETMPSNYGESAVLRILDSDKLSMSLHNLGFSDNVFTSFKDLLKQPQGMILVVGPTGSGKTTTLYAALNESLDPEKEIVTIEDPIEYSYGGIIKQHEVNEAQGFYFSNALKGLLRSAPDVIMVGEIRDKTTANIAIRAVNTGHLLLSTLHSINATSSFQRIQKLNIGLAEVNQGEIIQSYDIEDLVSCITGVLGQRLVRRVCPECLDTYSPSSEELSYFFGKLNIAKDFEYIYGRGCSKCDYSGYSGRLAINELLITDKHGLYQLKEDNPLAIRTHSISNGFRSFYLDSINKIKLKQTTLQELIRVVPNIEFDKSIYENMDLSKYL